MSRYPGINLASAAARPRSLHARTHTWADLDEPSLLDVRFRDLKLRIEDSIIQPELTRLYEDLERRGIRFKPHAWASTEWFSPDGIPGFAIPFFAMHPRLRELERRMMGEVEGGSSKWRLRILRHEAGHALDTAYGLRRRADFRRVFGPAGKPYPYDYSVRPGSRRFVLHLGYWYAQSHPTEDFAETFAVWLQPKARWRREYAGWPALEKLEFVDELMEEIAGTAPRRRDRSLVAPLSREHRSIGEYYREKKRTYEPEARRYDTSLKRVFTARRMRPAGLSVGRFIRENRAELRRDLIWRTETNAYLVDHAIELVRKRARDLGLVLRGSSSNQLRTVSRLHEHVVLDMLRRNRERYVL